MTDSIAIARLLRRFNAAAAPANSNSPTDGWHSRIEAVKSQLHCRSDLAAGAIDTLESLQRQLHAERLAHTTASQQLAETQAELTATQAALAMSRRKEHQARHNALHDSLTALPNRAFFRSRLDEALRRDGEDGTLAVLVLDLDGFKPVNDAHGHATGDELLKIVAARLARSVRSTDWVARLGGDEFACVMTGVPGRERLQSLAGALYDAISEPIALGGLRLRIRPSIGIAVHDGAADSDTLLRRADAAMFAAKRARSGPTFCETGAG